MTRARDRRETCDPVSPSEYAGFCAAAQRFAALRPWATMSEQPVAVEFAGAAEPHFAIALGASGEYVGMGLLRGLHGLAWLILTEAGGDIDPDVQEELDEVAFSMGPSSDLTPWDRAQRKAAGMRARRGEAVASILVKRPGLAVSAPTSDDVRRLAVAADAFAVAYAAGHIGATGPGSDAIWTLVVPDRAERPVRVESRRFDPPQWVEASPVAPPPTLRARPRGRGHLVVAIRTLTATIDGDDRVVRAIVCFDGASGSIVANGVVSGVSPEDAAHEFWGLLGSLAARGLPDRVTIANRRLDECVRDGLVGLGVRVAYDPALPGLREILDALDAAMSAGASPRRRSRG